MRKSFIYLIVIISLLLQGCVTNKGQEAAGQLSKLIDKLVTCSMTKQSLQPFVYDDVTLIVNQFQSYSPLEQSMMCGLYRMMYDETWDIKEVKIINDSAVAIVISDQYRYQDALTDLMEHLVNTFGDEVYQAGTSDEAMSIKEVEREIKLFYQNNGEKYLLEEMKSLSIPMVNSLKEWRVKNLRDLAFVK